MLFVLTELGDRELEPGDRETGLGGALVIDESLLVRAVGLGGVSKPAGMVSRIDRAGAPVVGIEQLERCGVVRGRRLQEQWLCLAGMRWVRGQEQRGALDRLGPAGLDSAV